MYVETHYRINGQANVLANLCINVCVGICLELQGTLTMYAIGKAVAGGNFN
jgi:hypothetical protein